MEQMKHRKQILPPFKRSDILVIVVTLVLAFGLIATIAVMNQDTNLFSKAAAVEPENGSLRGNVTVVSDLNASGGKYVRFGNIALVSPVTFTPSPVPLSDAEITNPQRGGYPYGYIMNPSGWPILDAYDRFDWADFEISQGVYNWSWMESRLAKAASRGGRWGFRIMAANSMRNGNRAAVPQYLMTLMSKGFWFTYPGNSYQTYAPDWNDPNFLNRTQALLTAIADKYGNDPRLGWVEIGTYGDWSEWHVWQYPYSGTPYGPSPTGAIDMTSRNKKQLIQVYINAFPNKQVVMMMDEGGEHVWAINNYPKLGLRRDCLGYPEFMDSHTWSKVQNQWQKAPFITETCYISSGSGGFDLALSQVSKYHIAMVSGHNMQSYNTLTSSVQSTLRQVYKTAGYRIQLQNITLPSAIDPGASFSVTSNWLNTGVTPLYKPWNIMLQLRNDSGTAAWQGHLAFDLQKLLPTESTPVAATDTFTLPPTIPTGVYTVALQINDPDNYYKPLNLAIYGRQTDGSYILGQIAVSPGESIPPVTIPPATRRKH
jgi:hypothetical protein